MFSYVQKKIDPPWRALLLSEDNNFLTNNLNLPVTEVAHLKIV